MVAKKAFTLIELVFTIVVISLTFTMVPTLLSQNATMQNESNLEEAIFASATKMSQILSYQWDENSINVASGSTSGALVLDTQGATSLQRLVNTSQRVGHFAQNGRRKLYTNSTFAGSLQKETNTTDDIDDFITLNTSLLNAQDNSYGYKASYALTINVAYVNDALSSGSYNDINLTFDYPTAALGTTSNIKHITVITKDDANQTLFELHTYSSNIGENTIASRSF